MESSVGLFYILQHTFTECPLLIFRDLFTVRLTMQGQSWSIKSAFTDSLCVSCSAVQLIYNQ